MDWAIGSPTVSRLLRYKRRCNFLHIFFIVNSFIIATKKQINQQLKKCRLTIFTLRVHKAKDLTTTRTNSNKQVRKVRRVREACFPP